MTADGTGAHTYQWDGEGRLASVDSGSTWAYTYNALGERAQETLYGTAMSLIYDPAGKLMSMPGAWSYVPLGNRDWVFYANGETVFSHPNALGSSQMQTNYYSTVVQDMLYYPWGQVWQWPQTGSGYHFAGMILDTYDWKHMAPFRHLSPALGRWLSPDPDNAGAQNDDPQSWNAYAYVGNNPTTRTDPDGEDYQVCETT